MSTLGSRIRAARGNTSQEAFAKQLQISKTSLGFYERGVNLPNTDVVLKICSEAGVSLQWLMTGDGEMRPGEQEPQASLPKSEVARRLIAARAQAESAPNGNVEGSPRFFDCGDCQIMMLPMVEARLSAGTGSFETGENVERRYAFRTDFLMRKGQPSSMVLMRVAGDSMEPEVHHNDVVLIDQSQRTPRPGGLYAVGVEDLVYLKVVNAAPGKLVLTSYNAAYPPLEIDARGDLEDGIRIIGKAVWVGRELT